MGSACPADDIWHPRYRQIHPFVRPGRFLRAYGPGAQGRRTDPASPRPSPEKTQSFVAKYEGGERRLDVVEFIVIARALGADPLKLMATFVTGGKGKPAGAKKPAAK